jgi:cytochrome c
MVALVGCGEKVAVKTAAEYLLEAPYVNADLGNGEMVSLECKVCHTFGVGEEHRLGPNLNGVFGRQAGTLPGFRYSPAMQEFGAVWTPETLDAWLAAPAAFVPNSMMVFVGLNEEDDRRDLIAYLLRETSRPLGL